MRVALTVPTGAVIGAHVVEHSAKAKKAWQKAGPSCLGSDIPRAFAGLCFLGSGFLRREGSIRFPRGLCRAR